MSVQFFNQSENKQCCTTNNGAGTITIDPEVVCLSNDGGVTIVQGFEVFDVTTNPPTSKLYIGGVEAVGYNVVPCSTSTNSKDYSYSYEKVCVDGQTWTKWYVWDATVAVPTLVAIQWLDENDALVTAPNPSLINNVNCVGTPTTTCAPSISEAFGNDLSTLQASHTFEIKKSPNANFTISVVTSIGTFTMPSWVSLQGLADFGCLYTIDSITILSGTGTLADIHIIGNKLY